jgi:glycolate oxidase FAD binding subunit
MNSRARLTLEETVAKLSAVAGPDFVRLDGASIVVEPGSIEEIAEALRFANANELNVTPTGGGTKSAWGNPVATDILLSIRRLNRLREHAWQDMTCTVEAGCKWSDMQLELQKHRQMVALDALWADRATVGGIVATNDSGALRLKYGGLRDLVIGATIVLADGTIARSGGKVVKNVAGYDLHKLMIGGFGTLGVIVEINFRLHPIEAQRRTWTIRAVEPILFREPLAALLDSQIVPSSIQIRSTEQRCELDICVAGLPETIGDSLNQIRQILKELEIAESEETIWLDRQRLFDESGDLILKASVVPGEICSVMSYLRRCAAEASADVAIVAEAPGLMTVALSSPPESALAFVDQLRDQVSRSGGSVVALQVPEMLRGRVDVWGPLPNSTALMREIKKRFDPNHILNPGRFVGGI